MVAAAPQGGHQWREKSVTGKTVDPESALTVPHVLGVIKILAQDISSLPLKTYKRLKPRGKEEANDFYLYALLHDAPNPEHTAVIFRELMVSHIIAWGNFFAQKIVNNAGQVMELWPLNPSQMYVDRDPDTNERRYNYRNSKGKPIPFREEEIWHIPGFGYDGLVGYSMITLMRDNIATAMSAQEYRGKFFENDARPGIVLRHPKVLKQEAFDHLRESWDNSHKGSYNSHKPAILEDGLELQEIGIPGEDVEFIATSNLTLQEFAGVMRVPGFMVGFIEKSTSWGTSLEQQMIGYANFGLRPWAVRIEQAAKKDLLLDKERKVYYVEHLFEVLLRGDTVARYQAYGVAITNGIMNPNEARERENMNPYPEGDEYRMPLNTGTAGTESEQAQNRAQAFAPVVMDAAARCLRREAHDLLESARKFAKRQDMEGMGTWLDGFYGADHTEFMMRQFEPATRSMLGARVFAADRLILEEKELQEALRGFCEKVNAAHADVAKGILASVIPGPAFAEVAKGLIDTLEAQISNLEKTQAGAMTNEFMQHMLQRLEK